MSLVQSTPYNQMPSGIITADYRNMLVPERSTSGPQTPLIPALREGSGEIYLVEKSAKKVKNEARDKYSFKIVHSPHLADKRVIE